MIPATVQEDGEEPAFGSRYGRPIVRRGFSRQLVGGLAQNRNVSFGGDIDEPLDHVGLDGHSDIVDIHDLFRRDYGDGGSTTRDNFDQPFAFQLSQRLADGCAAHPGPFTEFPLDETLAGFEPAEADRFVEPLNDLMANHSNRRIDP